MRIAVDNQISGSTINLLENKGHKVVFWARHEHDEWWFLEALDKGADIFISPDWDIVILANQHDVPCIHLPQGLKGKDQATYILHHSILKGGKHGKR